MTTELGLHYDVPEADYFKLDALGQTDLKAIARCPAIWKHEKDNPKEPTESQVLGTAVHDVVRDPETFHSRYHVYAPFDRRTKVDKQRWTDLVNGCLDAGLEPIRKDDVDTICAMRDSLFEHPEASRLMQLPGKSEVVALYEVPLFGRTIKRKAMMDRVPDDKNEPIIDLKSWVNIQNKNAAKSFIDGHRSELVAAMFKWGYHAQSADYKSAYLAVMEELRRFVFIFVEKTPPYTVDVFEVGQVWEELGWDMIVKGMKRYARCMDTGRWESYSEGTQLLEPRGKDNDRDEERDW